MKKSIASFMATGLGVGLLPKAPGTWGSLLGTIFAFLAYSQQGRFGLFALLVVTTFGGLIATHYVLKESHFKEPDPSYIVIDEMAGITFTLLLVDWFMGYILPDLFILSFILFRLFDIWKPFPISWIDRSFGQQPKTAALGVIVDDLLAAIPAAIGTSLITHCQFYILIFFRYLFS